MARRGRPPRVEPTVDPVVLTLRERRERLGLSQTEASQRMGHTSNMIGVWESGANAPGLSSLRRWAEALGAELTVVSRSSG